jgi:hypothetical protein
VTFLGTQPLPVPGVSRGTPGIISIRVVTTRRVLRRTATCERRAGLYPPATAATRTFSGNGDRVPAPWRTPGFRLRAVSALQRCRGDTAIAPRAGSNCRGVSLSTVARSGERLPIQWATCWGRRTQMPARAPGRIGRAWAVASVLADRSPKPCGACVRSGGAVGPAQLRVTSSLGGRQRRLLLGAQGSAVAPPVGTAQRCCFSRC